MVRERFELRSPRSVCLVKLRPDLRLGQMPVARRYARLAAEDMDVAAVGEQALHERSGERRIMAVGKDAWAMLGRTPGDIRVIRPIRDGLITEFDVAEALLRHQKQ